MTYYSTIDYTVYLHIYLHTTNLFIILYIINYIIYIIYYMYVRAYVYYCEQYTAHMYITHAICNVIQNNYYTYISTSYYMHFQNKKLN